MEKVKGETFEEFRTAINLTLTTDIWTDTMNMKSFLGVTAHFGFDIVLYAVTLGVYELDQRHTSDYIAAELIKTCEAWGIHKEKVSVVVTDNAANMFKAVELAFGKKTYSLFCPHTKFSGPRRFDLHRSRYRY